MACTNRFGWPRCRWGRGPDWEPVLPVGSDRGNPNRTVDARRHGPVGGRGSAPGPRTTLASKRINSSACTRRSTTSRSVCERPIFRNASRGRATPFTPLRPHHHRTHRHRPHHDCARAASPSPAATPSSATSRPTSPISGGASTPIAGGSLPGFAPCAAPGPSGIASARRRRPRRRSKRAQNESRGPSVADPRCPPIGT
jgi:hypothetical protein